ncbi:hypothetical protein ACIPM2_01460 [Streptomyces sp. NPDC086081]|uniref:hypothetical protein n=1 Tax=Streptomyces sp. NPDC086081 TaxID=3365749 RepID=UPI0037F430EA
MARYHSEAGGADGDPLMAAITGEPLPQDADAAARAEHRAARADVALLREQLGLVGDALADAGEAARPAGAPRAARRRPWPRRGVAGRGPRGAGQRPGHGGGTEPRTAAGAGRWSRHPGIRATALGLAAAAALAGATLGLGRLVSHEGSSADTSAASGESGSAADKAATPRGPAYLACAELVVEGTVGSVAPGPEGGEDRVTLDVTRSYKPARSEGEVTFRMTRGSWPRPAVGDRLLVGIRPGAATPDLWAHGERRIARERAWIVPALPSAERTTCEE